MNTNNVNEFFLEQLTSIISEYERLREQSEQSDLSDLDYNVIYSMITRSRAAVERVTGIDSVYAQQMKEILEIDRKYAYDSMKLQMLIGVVQSLKTDVETGFLVSMTELIHGEIFADFLEMGNYLLSEGYKDAAAVLAGGTLEAHLRQLCVNNQIDIEFSTNKGIQPKKADSMNSDLARERVYSKLDQKNVTAWLDLRNKAAHGHYDSYSSEQVALLVTGIRDFITRCPA